MAFESIGATRPPTLSADPDLPEDRIKIPTASRAKSASDVASEALEMQAPNVELQRQRFELENEVMRQKIEDMKRNRRAQHRRGGGISGVKQGGARSGSAIDAPVTAGISSESLSDRTKVGTGPGSLADRVKSSSAARLAEEGRTRAANIAKAGVEGMSRGQAVAADLNRRPAAEPVSAEDRASQIARSPGVSGPVTIRTGQPKWGGPNAGRSVTADSTGRVQTGPNVSPIVRPRMPVTPPGVLAMTPQTAAPAVPAVPAPNPTEFRPPTAVTSVSPSAPIPAPAPAAPAAVASAPGAAAAPAARSTFPVRPTSRQPVEAQMAGFRQNAAGTAASVRSVASTVSNAVTAMRQRSAAPVVAPGSSAVAGKAIPSRVRPRMATPSPVRQTAIMTKRNPMLASGR